MAYTPSSDFDAAPCGYEAPYRLEVDFDRACLPGSTRLNLCGTPGLTTLVLGCYSEPVDPTADDVEVTVGAQTRKPTAAVGISKSRDLVVAGLTRPPSLLAIVGKVDRVDVAARTRAPTLAARVVPVPKVSVGATTRRPRLAADLAYDPNLLSDVVALTEPSWKSGAGLGHGAQIRIPEAVRASWGGMADWSPAVPEHGTGESRWIESPGVTGGRESAWRDAHGQRGGSTDRWLGAPKIDRSGRENWRGGYRLDGGQTNQWHPHPPHYHGADRSADPPNDFHGITVNGYPPHRLAVDFPGGPYQWAQRPGRNGFARGGWNDGRTVHGPGLRSRFGDGERLPSRLWECWQDAALVPFVWRVPPPYVPPPWERDWSNNLCLIQPLGSPLDLGFYGCGWTPEPGATIPIRRVYLVIHDISLTRLSDGVEIPCRSLSLALDADSWAWTWSGELLGPDALDAVRPVADEPVTLVAEINGYTWHLLAEEWSEDREFARRGIKVSGRGLSAWLAAPYELPASGILANARTIQQAMGELLPFDWTLTWELGAPDWMLPAGSWSRTNQTTIQAIHAAAQESGLIVVPAMADRALHVQRRYPVLPWEYAAATPDLVVPDAAILQLAKRRQAEAQANAVFVHGGEVGGILARVYRTGSAGDRLAPTQSSALVTHADAARTLGGRILAAHDAQPELRSVTLPLGGDFLLGAVGELLRVEEGATVHRGIINAVSVQATRGDRVTVRQTLTIGEDTPNQWARFRRLVPGDPLLAGEIAIDYGDGTVKVDLIGGGSVRVRGSGSGNVYVRGGQVVGEAPNLSAVEIDI